MSEIVFLHGLESTVDADLKPVGRKARYLAAHYPVTGVALDTSEARRILALRLKGSFSPGDYERAFATPLARAREAIDTQTRLVIGSSFGGAVLLRLLHETPAWTGPSLFLAGAGVKLTPYRALPPDVPCLLVHGERDTVVPFADSEQLAATSPKAELWSVDDDHRLATIVEGLFADAIAHCLSMA